MLANFFQYFGRKPDDEYERAFVKEIHVLEQPARNRRVDRVLAVGWVLIAIKSVAVWWACTRYQVPIHPLWVIAPTILFGLLCTAIYAGKR